ncbi:MAG: hypothetical protein U0105_10560 [Candidatus Obscuribacterales bacterium]
MTPGGTDETLSLRLNIISNVSSPVTVEVAPDLAIMPDAADDEGVRTLAKNLVEDRIAYLKRLSIAIESQIAAVQKARAELLAASPPAPAEEVDKLTAEASTLSLRQSRLSTSLSGQRAMFMALGGTDEEYRVALDEAVGGAYLLGSKKPGDVFAANAQLEELRRQRRLAEPRMKLLPPENWNGSEFVEVASTSSPAPSEKEPSSTNVEPVPPEEPSAPKPAATPAVTKPAEKPKPVDKPKPAAGKGKTATTKGGGAKKQAAPVRSTRTQRGSKSTRAVRSTRKSSQRAAGRSTGRSTKKSAGGRRKRDR